MIVLRNLYYSTVYQRQALISLSVVNSLLPPHFRCLIITFSQRKSLTGLNHFQFKICFKKKNLIFLNIFHFTETDYQFQHRISTKMCFFMLYLKHIYFKLLSNNNLTFYDILFICTVFMDGIAVLTAMPSKKKKKDNCVENLDMLYKNLFFINRNENFSCVSLSIN